MDAWTEKMNSLQAYGSDSEVDDDLNIASSSKAASINQQASTLVKRARNDDGEDTSDEEESEKVDKDDLFGIKSISTEATSNGKRISNEKALLRTAPEVPTDPEQESNSLILRQTDTEMHVNVPYKDMIKQMQGPENPFSQRKMNAQQNTLNGHIETAVMTDFDFRNQQRTFETMGYARNPNQYSNSAYIGDTQKAMELAGSSAIELRNGPHGSRQLTNEIRKKRKGLNGDSSIVEGEGAYIGPWGGWEEEKVERVGPSEEEIKRVQALDVTRKQEEAEALRKRQEEEARGTEKSIFHGKSMYDYQGRTYMHVPTDVDTNLHGEAGAEESFLPKACIHTFTGHTKAISAMRLFPRSGHLLLSSSMDTKIKLWDVYHEGNCLRTYMGHSKAVKDVTFSNDGRKFLSSGYDRQIKLWDTETGECLQAFSPGKMPNVIKFHPDEDKQHIFLAGMSDKKIIQYDINSGELTQEYDSHLGPVNTITFVDENRRFVTTSDDKSMRAWDFDIPVVIKYISDPLMHSMPAVTVHPNRKWIACQSLDSQIVVYASESFRQNRKKAFKGHNVAGYACQVGFSPDGRYISSGDGSGNLVIWDWKSGRLLKRLRAHKEVVIGHEWLPHETSKLITASWDGTMKLWD